MTANKQKIVDEMILEIESGKCYSETFAVNGSKWQLSERTFTRYWNDANEAYSDILERRKEIFIDKSTLTYIEGVEMAIMSKTQKFKILESIILGATTCKKYFHVNGELEEKDITPNLIDRMKAIEIHNKMQGDFITDKVKADTPRRKYIFLDGTEKDGIDEDDDD